MLAAMLVAAFSAFLVASLQPPVYRATTTLMIGRTLEDPNPNPNQFDLDQRLAETYAELANRELIYVATANALGLSELPEVEIEAVPGSQLLDIAVTDTNAQRAAVVANEMANQLILNSPTGPKADEQERQQFVAEQLQYFELQIKNSQEEIERLQGLLGTLTSARQISDTQSQISALQEKLTALQSTYANLLLSANTGASNTITVLVSADVPTKPIGPNKPLIAAMAAFAGLALAAAAAYGMESFSNTLKNSEEVSRILKAPVIGYIPFVNAENRGVYSFEYPYSAFAEGFRLLRTNLEFARSDRSVKTILVSSAGPADGKSTVATNLALVMAQANKRVILIGADLRQPLMHELLKVPQSPGLSEILQNTVSLDTALKQYGDPPLMIIPSGNPPTNPAELLASSKMNQVLSYLREHADVIILDTTPFFISDATILASRVDGVLLVVRPDYTRKDALQVVHDQLSRIGGKVLGVVVNGIAPTGDHYSTYYTRYGYGSEGKDKEKPKKRKDERKNEPLPQPEAATRSVIRRADQSRQ